MLNADCVHKIALLLSTIWKYYFQILYAKDKQVSSHGKYFLFFFLETSATIAAATTTINVQLQLLNVCSSPGDHCRQKQNGQYFDSFGRPPSQTFKCYLDRHCRTWTYNRTQFQSAASKFCGQYCVVWCILSSRTVDLSSLLSSDTGLNDSIVRQIVSRM